MHAFKKLLLWGLLVGFLSVVMVGCGAEKKGEKGASPPQEKQVAYNLKFAGFVPVTHLLSTEADQFFMKRVEELTNGKVKFTYYPAEQLCKSKDMLDIVQAGTAEVGHLPVVYVSGKVPLTAAFELPGLADDLLVANKACNKVVQEKFYDLEFKKLGVRPLLGYLQLFYEVHTIKKPVKSISDLKGLKMRVAGGGMEETAKHVGSTPISLPSAELYETLQRGIVDGLFFPHYNCEPYKLNEILKYATVGTNFGSTFAIFGINDKLWQEFPEDIKKAFKQAADETVINLSKKLMAANEASIKKAEQQGKVMYYLKPEERKEWAEFMKPVHEKWIAEMEKRGLPAREVYNIYLAALKEMRG